MQKPSLLRYLLYFADVDCDTYSGFGGVVVGERERIASPPPTLSSSSSPQISQPLPYRYRAVSYSFFLR